MKNIKAIKSKRKLTTRDICYSAIFTAVIAIMAQISIPLPLGIPFTMQTFAITLAAVILGARLSTISSLIYIILGAIGVPVLSNFTGGLAKFAGPTGGFLISFPIMAFIIGLGADNKHKFKGLYTLSLITGTTINLTMGTIMFCLITETPISAGISACITPFIPSSILKAVFASIIGFKLRNKLIVENLM